MRSWAAWTSSTSSPTPSGHPPPSSRHSSNADGADCCSKVTPHCTHPPDPTGGCARHVEPSCSAATPAPTTSPTAARSATRPAWLTPCHTRGHRRRLETARHSPSSATHWKERRGTRRNGPRPQHRPRSEHRTPRHERGCAPSPPRGTPRPHNPRPRPPHREDPPPTPTRQPCLTTRRAAFLKRPGFASLEEAMTRRSPSGATSMSPAAPTSSTSMQPSVSRVSSSTTSKSATSVSANSTSVLASSVSLGIGPPSYLGVDHVAVRGPGAWLPPHVLWAGLIDAPGGSTSPGRLLARATGEVVVDRAGVGGAGRSRWRRGHRRRRWCRRARAHR
jgi:hypothetical protein